MKYNWYAVTPELKEWAAGLAAARIKAQLTQSAVQKQTKVPATVISATECGRGLHGHALSSTTFDKFDAIADTLGYVRPVRVPVEDPRSLSAGVRATKPQVPRMTYRGQPVKRLSNAATASGTAAKMSSLSRTLVKALLDLVATGKLSTEDMMTLMGAA